MNRASSDCSTFLLLALAVSLASPLAAEDWAVVNSPLAPLLDRPSVTAQALSVLYPGMRVLLLDPRPTFGYARVQTGDSIGYMRAQELLRGFLPEDKYPGPGDNPEPAFLASDRDGDGTPDFRDIVHAARDMLGLPFDDPAALQLAEPGRLPDGLHRDWANDRRDNNGDGLVDDRDEDVIVCVDLLVRAVERAGFPLSDAIARSHRERPAQYREGVSGAVIGDEFLTRRVRNLAAFVRNSADFRYFPEPDIHAATTYPRERARPGDLLFFGLTKDLGQRRFKIQHSGICVSTNPATGLPVWIITGVVPRVQFYNLQKGYHRFTYCGHARLGPAATCGSPSTACGPQARTTSPDLAQPPAPATGISTAPVTRAAAEAGGTIAVLGGLPAWAILGHPPVARAPAGP